MQGALKAIVAILGVMIVGCLGMIGYGFSKLSEDPNWRLLSGVEESSEASGATAPNPPARPAAAAPPANGGLGGTNGFSRSIALNLIKGCRIEGSLIGGPGVLIIKTGPREAGGGCGSLFIVDLAAGSVASEIRP